jgi:hypothetical protein
MKSHNTEQSARGYIMFQLARRGYTIQFTDSRFPLEDLVCISPSGKHFGIDVKGQVTKNYWLLKKPIPNPELFYAFVYIPGEGEPSVFIMDSDTTLKCWLEMEQETYRRIKIGELSPIKNEKSFPWGLHWTTPHLYKDRYDVLPA